MNSGRDGDSGDRGVSEVLGAILVFGLVLAVLALVQLSAVPAANQQIEFEHSQRVAGDFQELDGNVEQVAATGTAQSTRIEAGARYPPRLFLLNPPPVSGSLRTEDTGNIVLENVRATNPETADYWGGSPQNRETVALNYSADYNEYAAEPVVRYENGLLYRQFQGSSQDVVVDGGSIVSGRRIDLTVLDGSLSTSSVNEISVDAQPVSAPSQKISITNEGSEVRITIPTRLSDEKWVGDILNTEIDSNARPSVENPTCADVGLGVASPDPSDGRYVVDCTYTSGSDGGLSTIEIVLEEGVTYDLQMAKVGIGTGSSPEDPAYLTTASVTPRIVALGGNNLAVEVRDRFNSGESGVDVEFNLEEGSGSFIDDQGQDAGTNHIVRTDESGRADVAFKPTGNDPVTISATADLGYSGVDDRETVVFEDLAVIGGGGGDGGEEGEFNPADSEAFELISADLQVEDLTPGPGTDNNGVVYMTFQNRGSDTSIEAVRINSFVQNAQSANNQKQPAYALIDGTKVDVRGDYVQTFEPGFQVDYTQGQEESYRAVFYESDGDPYDFTEADFFVYSIRFEDGSVSRYFVVPDAP